MRPGAVSPLPSAARAARQDRLSWTAIDTRGRGPKAAEPFIVGMYASAVADATSGWDIAGTIADIIAGIGTAGALIWAIFLYRRQVQDNRTDQASRIFITLVAADNTVDDHSELAIENNSDLPVFDVLIILVELPHDAKANHNEYTSARLHPKEYLTIDRIAATGSHKAAMAFTDAAGRGWVRDTAGRLKSDDGQVRNQLRQGLLDR